MGQKYITQHQEYQAVQGFWIWVQLEVLPAAWGYRQGRCTPACTPVPPVGWGVQENWSHPLWGSLRATKVWGLSQGSCGAWTKVDKVCWCSWSWFSTERWWESRHGWVVGGVDTESTWVAGGVLIKEFQVWQVQEALQWSACFVGFTTWKYWQNVLVQSHLQHCVLSARWLMENTLCACRTQWWLIAPKSL